MGCWQLLRRPLRGGTLMRTVSFAFAFGLMLLAGCAYLTPTKPAPRSELEPAIDSAEGADRLAMWQADIATYESWMRSRHAGLFTVVSESEFNASLDALRADLPTLRDDQVVVRLKAISASIGSSHTGAWPSRGKLKPRRLPIEVRWLDDGVVVAATDEPNAAILGGTIVAIGDSGIDTVIAAITSITGHENEWYLRGAAPRSFSEAETLSGLGLVASPDRIPVTVRFADGREATSTLSPLAEGAPAALVSAVPPGAASFTRLPRPDGRIYGTRYVEGSAALYVWYDSCANAAEQSVAQFARETLREIDRRNPRVVVIDLRRNGGGDSGLLRPLIDGLARRPTHNTRESLVVLIGPRTFSSAGLNAGEFRSRTKATLLGQPTGQRPDSWFECRWDWLPNSLIQVNYMLTEPSFRPGVPDAYYPDVYVPVTCADDLSGRDVVFERALELAGK